MVVAVIAIAAALALSTWQPFRMVEARYFDHMVPLFAPDLQALSGGNLAQFLADLGEKSRNLRKFRKILEIPFYWMTV